MSNKSGNEIGGQAGSKLVAALTKAIEILRNVLEELQEQDVRIPHEIAERFRHFREQDRCLACGEPIGKEGVTRGCHKKCYSRLMQHVSRGKYTTKELLLKGWMQPAGRGGRRSKPLPLLPPAISGTVIPNLPNPDMTRGPETPTVEQGVAEGIDRMVKHLKPKKKSRKPPNQ